MKRYIIVVFLIISVTTFAQEEKVNLKWLTSIEKAQKVSKKSKKPILVFFTGSDWCTPCRKLEEDFFSTEEFIKKSDNFILVIIDKPFRVDIISEKQMEYNNKVIAKYNPKKTFPKMLILNSKGKVLDKMSGYSYYGETSNHFAFINRNI